MALLLLKSVVAIVAAPAVVSTPRASPLAEIVLSFDSSN